VSREEREGDEVKVLPSFFFAAFVRQLVNRILLLCFDKRHLLHRPRMHRQQAHRMFGEYFWQRVKFVSTK
jgi:hypothetical protein